MTEHQFRPSLPWEEPHVVEKPPEFSTAADLVLKGIHIKFIYFFNFSLELCCSLPVVSITHIYPNNHFMWMKKIKKNLGWRSVSQRIFRSCRRGSKWGISIFIRVFSRNISTLYQFHGWHINPMEAKRTRNWAWNIWQTIHSIGWKIQSKQKKK